MNMQVKNIRALREKQGYSQEQVAGYLDISIATVNQYETDTLAIPATTVSRLALLFNVDEYDLYQDKPQQHPILSAFTFPVDNLLSKDLKSIAEFKKIVLNYSHLVKALKSE